MRTFGTTHNTALENNTHVARTKVVIITPVEGTVIYLIDDSANRTIGAHTYKSGVIQTISPVGYQASGSASRITIEVFADGTNITTNQLFGNLLDNASVSVYLVDALTTSTGLGTDVEFAGHIAQISPMTEYGFARIEVAGPLSKSKTLVLRKYRPMCDFDLYEPNTCGVTLATYTRTATVAVASGHNLTISGLSGALPAGHTFALGMLKYTSGAQKNKGAEIRTYDGSTGFQLYLPMIPAPEVGDTLELYAGCSHTPAGCTLFANRLRYGGFPHVPGQDANAITYTASSFG